MTTNTERLLLACNEKNWDKAIILLSLVPDLDPSVLTVTQRRRLETSLSTWKGEPINEESIENRLMGHYTYCAQCGGYTRRYKTVEPSTFWPNPEATMICANCDAAILEKEVG